MEKYKILIVKNSYTKKINLTKYLTDWFKKYNLLEITIDEISTNFPVTPVEVGNGTYKGIICGADIIPKLRTVVPENKYNAVILYAGNLSGGIRVSVCNGENRQGNLYHNTELIQLRKVSDSGKEANHELFHAFFAKANRIGIPIIDTMDTYQNDSNLVLDNIIDTNREMCLQSLKNYWDKICAFNTPTPIIVPVLNTTSRWKHFKMTEKTGSLGHTVSELDPNFVDKLDELREICGFPFKITSGYRTVEENKKVGGVAGSAHTRKIGVDIACTDAEKRMIIVGNAWNNGFIGIGVNSVYIHLDFDTSNKRRIWLY